jgi:phosphopantetheine adenylyltransferase
MQTKSNKVRHIITLTTGQYDHLYNIMCSQDEIIDYLNESDDFDPQTFDNLFDAICAAKETYCHDNKIQNHTKRKNYYQTYGNGY